jgi:hypothetical protein
MPYNFFNNLLYDFTMVEVMPYQTAGDAIQQNIPVIRQAGLNTLQFQYPREFAALDTAKLYAWRVFARNNTLPVASSEVWTFRVTPQKEEGAIASFGQHARLSTNESAAFTTTGSVLRYLYNNRGNLKEVEMEIFDLGNGGRKKLHTEPIIRPVEYGQNFISLDLNSVKGIKDKGFYLLKVTGGAGSEFLKFQYRK